VTSHGRIACGVSTSGWAWKYPGRLGDSPIVGAGNYADDRFGAAACTGRGEMAQRLCTAHSVVMAMRFGRSLDEALSLAAKDLHALHDPYASEVNIVAIDHHGNHAAVSTTPGKTYVVQTGEMSAPQELERRHVRPGRLSSCHGCGQPANRPSPERSRSVPAAARSCSSSVPASRPGTSC
jgi:beta-aspartyl-peptidase (threonine type)